MKSIIVLLSSLVLMTGCDTTEVFAELDYVDDADRKTLYFDGHEKLCKETTDTVLCFPQETIGDIQPTWAEVMEVVNELSSNFTYVTEKYDTWNYNLTIKEILKDDCDGVMGTLFYYLVYELGIDRKHLVIAVTYQGDGDYHVFLGVNTSDKGWTHFDYGNSGQPLEQLNWYMRADAEDFGVYGLNKGDFR